MEALDWLSPEKLPFYFLFFIPGFIALQVAALVTPTSDSDFTKRVPLAIGYSALNYAVLQIILIPVAVSRLPHLADAAKFLFTFIVPVFYPFIAKRVRDAQLFGFTNSYPRAWDFYFSRRLKRWVRVYMKDGSTVLGWYGASSTATTYPVDEQIYIEELFDANPQTNAWEPRASSDGAIICMSDVLYIEFFKT
jgi:Family of unknown function (DUF6338)